MIVFQLIFYLFIYLLSFGLLLHIKKKKKKRKQNKKQKKTDSKTKQNGQGSHYSLANYSGSMLKIFFPKMLKNELRTEQAKKGIWEQQEFGYSIT